MIEIVLIFILGVSFFVLFALIGCLCVSLSPSYDAKKACAHLRAKGFNENVIKRVVADRGYEYFPPA